MPDYEWIFADGTRVRSGGVVDGTTEFAEYLRFTLTNALEGSSLDVPIEPIPGATLDLDARDDSIVHAWLVGMGNRPALQLPDPAPPWPTVDHSDEDQSPPPDDAIF